MTICIIPARGGSQRIPGKNIKPFHGKPIINYSIEAAKECWLFDRVIVTTDSQDIANVAMAAGAAVWMRKPKYARDSVGTQEVVRECLQGLRIASNELVCCLYATAPLMALADLKLGFALITSNEDLDYVLSVGYPPLQDAGQFYWGYAHAFKESVPLIGPHTAMVYVDDTRVCDINTMDDWNRALIMYEDLH